MFHVIAGPTSGYLEKVSSNLKSPLSAFHVTALNFESNNVSLPANVRDHKFKNWLNL